ncbi:MMPL family transporter [Nitrogeniibacter mangrovi]|uniref:MMPL family transporter n=1 Tax=Nitrogeniibacter mangrovi TaxID=2016596 RepID=A0A6C1B0E4_9RHOO|nr:MMPL family transporter [Nitrogeniibacter mangrovi]QID16469.1 MMPL family transporter [Nitrogeniibacter mangrovi]
MKRRTPLIVWLLVLLVCAVGVSRTRFTADLSAFLPSAPTEAQALLVDLLRDGVASRMLLIGIEGGDAGARKQASQALAGALRASPAFVAVSNGESIGTDKDQRWLFDHRYRLSPAVTPERFSVAGLHAAIAESIDLLASSAGLLLKPIIARDPTAETLQVIEHFSRYRDAPTQAGLWTSRDGARTLLLATTAASGADTDGQAAAIATLRATFARLTTGAGHENLRLLVSGPGVFAVNARATIKDEVARLSSTGAALILILLLLIYRSPTALLLGLAPVATGALAGICAVSLGFGQVHGITLGFGLPLLGEAVDYAIYYFIQRDGADAGRFWRTIRLGVLTSVFGFGALLVTGFPGLAQVGLFSMTGLVTAVLTTRYVLPALTPARFAIRDVSVLGRGLRWLMGRSRRVGLLPLVAGALAAATLYVHRDHLWHHELGALSPVPEADQQLDARLRQDLPAPDVRFLVVASAHDADTALARAEGLGKVLDRLAADGRIGGFDSPARFLPSRATQAARIAALPDADTLRTRLAAATADLPLRADKLGPFIDDVAAARHAPALTRASLDGTALALAVDAMLIHHDSTWRALMPVRAVDDAHPIDPRAVRAALEASGVPDAVFVDIKSESERLYAGYLHEARTAAGGGVLAILILLAIALRSPARLLRLALPLLATVLVVIGALSLAGERLTLLHLVGMLLVVAVGSNYALFFDAGEHGTDGPSLRTLASLVVANLTTLAGFGILALSSVPVLHAIGIVVGPGALLALVFSALMHPATGPRRT